MVEKKMLIEYGSMYDLKAKYWGKFFQRRLGFQVLYRKVPEQVFRIKIGQITYEREDIPYIVAMSLLRGEDREREQE